MIGRVLWRLLLEQGGWSRIWYGLATAMVVAGGGLIYHQTQTGGGGDSTCPLPAYPDSTCTGYPSGQSFTTSGGITITQNGATYDGYHFTGQVNVDATNVTIKNSWIESNGADGIDVANGASLTVQDTDFDCGDGEGSQGIISAGTVVADRLDIYGGCTDGIFFEDNLTLRDSYIHELLFQNDTHNDGIQTNDTGPYTIQHNTIVGVDTSALQLCENTTDCSVKTNNVLVTQNLLSCDPSCAYTVYCPQVNTTNFVVSDNAFIDNVDGFGNSTLCTDEDGGGNFFYPSGTPYALE